MGMGQKLLSQFSKFVISKTFEERTISYGCATIS
jgi:hypothetical protein